MLPVWCICEAGCLEGGHFRQFNSWPSETVVLFSKCSTLLMSLQKFFSLSFAIIWHHLLPTNYLGINVKGWFHSISWQSLEVPFFLLVDVIWNSLIWWELPSFFARNFSNLIMCYCNTSSFRSTLSTETTGRTKAHNFHWLYFLGKQLVCLGMARGSNK